MKPQTARTWSYSEVIGAMLRQERQANDPTQPESVVEQLVRQLQAGKSIDKLELDMSTLVHCPECEPDLPCPTCRTDREDMAHGIRDHLRRIQASGSDPLTYLDEANRFHEVWQERFEQLHLAAMGGEAFC